MHLLMWMMMMMMADDVDNDAIIGNYDIDVDNNGVKLMWMMLWM